MLHRFIGLPPTYHVNAMTPDQVIVFLILFGVLMVGIAVTALILAVTWKKREQGLSQMKEEQTPDASQSPKGNEVPQVFAPEEEKEPLIRIPSLT
jgi:hypothetical protein